MPYTPVCSYVIETRRKRRCRCLAVAAAAALLLNAPSPVLRLHHLIEHRHQHTVIAHTTHSPTTATPDEAAGSPVTEH